MKVKDILMTVEPRTCVPGTNLAAAAALMLDGDCGVLPVVDVGRLAGVVTNRDLFIALATRGTNRRRRLRWARWLRPPLHVRTKRTKSRQALEQTNETASHPAAAR